MAMTKARNISMEVHSGVSELQELIDIMKNYWESWKTAKKESSKALRASGKVGKIVTSAHL